jgi:hypothetical protein
MAAIAPALATHLPLPSVGRVAVAGEVLLIPKGTRTAFRAEGEQFRRVPE